MNRRLQVKSFAAPPGRARPPGAPQTQLQSRPAALGENRPTALAFTRLELLGVLSALGFLAAVVLPSLANSRPRSDRVICVNNLRQIGMGLQLWGDDHHEQIPWHVAVADGGTKLHPLSANAWLHFSWLSNDLASAKVLLCPSDTGRPASDFTGSPSGGYLHSNYRNAATSYFLNAHPFGTFQGNRMVAGDRNLPVLGNSLRSVLAAVSIIGECPASVSWTTALHDNAGNLLIFDGQVEQANHQQLRAAVDFACSGADGSSYAHLCMPR